MKSQNRMRPSCSASWSTPRVVRLALLSLALAAGVIAPATSHDAPQRELVVGSEVDYSPFALGEADGEPDGFTVELWKAVASTPPSARAAQSGLWWWRTDGRVRPAVAAKA